MQFEKVRQGRGKLGRPGPADPLSCVKSTASLGLVRLAVLKLLAQTVDFILPRVDLVT